jgi:N-acetylmuramoyl-L-alanine amidase
VSRLHARFAAAPSERLAGWLVLRLLARFAAAPSERSGTRGRRWGVVPALPVIVGIVALVVAGCAGDGRRVTAPVAQSAPSPTVAPAPPAGQAPVPAPAPATRAKVQSSSARAPRATPPPTAPPPGRRPSGLVVVLDPGHNGGNAAHPEIINRPVPAGLGQTKPCNTVGAATTAGYAEHAFTFDVALRVRRLLTARGVTVLLTRTNDVGVGPCVNDRARFGNAHNAAAVVSIHGDGTDAAGTGFHVIEPAEPPADPAVDLATHRLALAVRAALLAKSGLGYATYAGGGHGLDHRIDLAGLNLSTRPATFVECGNMRNAADAAKMSIPAGRQRIARALADGILAALSR